MKIVYLIEYIFVQDASHLPLTCVNLRTSTAVNDKILVTLMTHFPRELDIHECPKLTSTSLQTINDHSRNLISLVIGTSTQILPTIFLSPMVEEGFLNCPKLMKLVIWNLATNVSVYWGHLTACFTNTLTSLDLSGCGEFQDFEFLRKCGRLRSLVLYNVLISGRVKGDRRGVEERGDDDEEMVEEVDVSAEEDRYVVFLRDEEDQGGNANAQAAQREGDGEVEMVEREEGVEEDIVNQVLHVRKRLEALVNKLISPICQLKDLR